MKEKILFVFFTINLAISAQTITGVVKNEAGTPIVNALVCQATNPSVFQKTNASGQYTIAGTSSTAIRVGALGYKTMKSTTLRNITLLVDPLLATDVYHISFDNTRAGDSYTENELKADFKCASGAGFNDGLAANDRASVDYGVSRDEGGVSLKVKYPKGKLKTSESGVDARIPLTKTFKDNDFQSTDLYVSYWIKFSDDYEFNLCGGKLPSLGGSVPDPNALEQARWKGRIMMRKGGGIQFYMELPGDDKFSPDNEERFWGEKVTNTTSGDICVFEYTNYLKQPGWHNIELHYRFETPTKPGIFEGWFDGANYDFMDASVFNGYRPAGSIRENITINAFLLSTFLGGTGVSYEPTKDLYAWFDEIRVSKTRINDFANYQTLSSGSDLQAEKKLEIFPNPSKGIFNLKEDAVWEVYTILGKSIAQGNGKIIDLEGKSKGVYFVKTNKNAYNKIILE